MTNKTQPASIEHLYNKFMAAFGSLRPIDQNERDTLAALAASADLTKTRMIVTRGFKAGLTTYQVGDVYPAAAGDRVQVIKFCRTGYILPEEEYKRGQDYTANKAKAERIKNLFRDLENARADVPRSAAKCSQAEAALLAAESEHAAAKSKAAKLESEILQAFDN